jgi:hypothetical protein
VRVPAFSGLDRLPNGPGRLASFGAPNDGPVRGMHFGGLVRPGTESEYLGPDIEDCSFRIRFWDTKLGSIRTPNPGCV